MNALTPTFQVKGEYAIDCVESQRLRLIRCRSFARHCATRNQSFDGSASHFLKLPPSVRVAIERDIVDDIRAHPKEWEHPEVAEVVESRPCTPNLVLDRAFDQFFAGTFGMAAFNRYCAVGIGTTTPAVTDTALATEVHRTGTVLPGVGNCGSTDNLSTGTRTYLRTHDFPAQVSNENFTELGWSDISTAGANLNSRVLITGGTVSALVGQQLRVRHSLALTISPITRQSATIGVTGWPISPAASTDGEWQVCNFGFGTVDTDGATGAAGIFEPVWTRNFVAIFYTGMTLPSFGTGPTVSGSFFTEGTSDTTGFGGWKTYTPGSFSRKVAFGAFSPGQWNSTEIRGYQYATVAWGCPGYYSEGGVLAVRFTDLQTKPNTHNLKAPGFTLSLSR